MNDNSGVVWITGAGKGIGRAVALKLAAAGRIVAASARTRRDLATLEAEARGGRIVPYPLDITDAAAAKATVTAIERDLGPIGLAMLNAGTHIPEHAEGFDLGAFEKVVSTNLVGTAKCFAAIVEAMLGRGHGQIAFVASVAGFRGLPSGGTYGATKAALINMAESLAPELKQKGVTMTLINPGFVDTPLTKKNPFPMPFLISAEEAAERIVRGLDRGTFEVVFPTRMMIAMKLLRILPYWAFFAITRGMVTPARPRGARRES